MERKHKRMPRLKFAVSLGAAAMVAIAMLATVANAQVAEEELPQLSTVIVRNPPLQETGACVVPNIPESGYSRQQH